MPAPPLWTTAVSCPGKVLIAGGYLVLDPAYSGTVVATSSRFNTAIQSFPDATDAGGGVEVEVRSPQFKGGRWFYSVSPSAEAGGALEVRAVPRPGSSSSPNKFVHLAVSESFKLALALGHQLAGSPRPYARLRVTVVGDNDFYSQPRGDVPLAPFNPLDATLSTVHKTGLGSSAAMVSSLCSAIVLHLTDPAPAPPAPQPRPPLSDGRRRLLHNLAQYVHSLAQGKVGSGFDVSAAVYGSHGYTRFRERCLADLLQAGGSTTCDQVLLALDPATNPLWAREAEGAKVEPFTLPPGTTLMLADVDAGSHTPSMVGKVLAWRKAQPEQAKVLWDDLGRENDRLRKLFERLNGFYATQRADYDASVQSHGRSPAGGSNPVADSFQEAAATMKGIRRRMKEMGSLAGVPIEPDEQTALLDACEELDGVIGSGVPGAGGYDALWVFVFSPPSGPAPPSSSVERLWSSWDRMSVKSLSRSAWVVGRGDGGEASAGCGHGPGLQVVDVARVEGLQEAVDREVRPEEEAG